MFFERDTLVTYPAYLRVWLMPLVCLVTSTSVVVESRREYWDILAEDCEDSTLFICGEWIEESPTRGLTTNLKSPGFSLQVCSGTSTVCLVFARRGGACFRPATGPWLCLRVYFALCCLQERISLVHLYKYTAAEIRWFTSLGWRRMLKLNLTWLCYQ